MRKAVNSFVNGDGNHTYFSIPTPWSANAVIGISHAYGGKTAFELGLATKEQFAFWGHAVEPFDSDNGT